MTHSMSDPDVSALITVQQAIRIIDAVPVHPRTRRVAIHDADGLRLAEPISTDRDYTPFLKSQMDSGRTGTPGCHTERGAWGG